VYFYMVEERNYQINITPEAVKQIKNQLIKRGTSDSALRLGIKGSGCNGYSYVIMFEDNPPKDRDIVFNIEDVQVIVDKKSILYLNGCTLDWEKTLMQQGFKFINPREISVCGCGSSFQFNKE